MTINKQTLLKAGKDNKHGDTLNGPVFEFGPGWGAKINKWVGKNFYKKMLPPIAVAALTIGVILTLPSGDNGENLVPKTFGMGIISQTVIGGDSYTHVTRRAISQYLAGNATISLTPGQKVFIEERLWREVADQPLNIGTEIKFNIIDIESQISQSKSLSPTALQKWEVYAQKVKF
ncbi:MAG: hypothetical protein HY506_00685 [Candidatus Yanofskybacteria bacterium]|nr:hypothetical protein [Candidatus Yanofskybacteria bacterium]